MVHQERDKKQIYVCINYRSLKSLTGYVGHKQMNTCQTQDTLKSSWEMSIKNKTMNGF